jgi:hypothetical protein
LGSFTKVFFEFDDNAPKSGHVLDMKISYILNVQVVTYVWVTKKKQKKGYSMATSTRLFKEELWKIQGRRIFTFINTCCCIVYNLR